MNKTRALGWNLGFIVVIATAAACGDEAPPAGTASPQVGGSGGRSPAGRSGGAGGSGPAAGTGGASAPVTGTGGSGGTGTGSGGSAGGADANAADQGAASDAPATGGATGSDGGGNATPTCSVTPGPAPANLKLSFQSIALPGLAGGGTGKSPTGLTELRFLPQAPNELLISQKGGGLTHYRLDGDAATLVRAYRIPGVNATADCGFVSFAVDPAFKDNKYVYAGYCTGTNSSKVTRFTLGETLENPVEIISFNEPDGTQAWHSVGSMGFDGTVLWMLHGEFTDRSNGQNLNTPLGKLLRLIPKAAGGYDPAPGNAFPPATAGRNPLIYAYGFRSPWRGYLDSRGRYLVGDVGDTSAEELNLVSKPGQNFGWGVRSGPCNGCDQINPLSTYRVGTDPYNGQGDELYESRDGRAIWVGVQYQNCGNDRYGGALTGVYIFGDIYTGWVRGAVIDDSGMKTTDRLMANAPAITAWAQAADGYLYALKFGNYGTGGLANEATGLFRVVKAP